MSGFLMKLYSALDAVLLYTSCLLLRRCYRAIHFSALATLTFASHLLSKAFTKSLARCSLFWNICDRNGRSNPNHRSLPCNPIHNLRRHQLRLPLLLNVSIFPPGTKKPRPQMVSHRREAGDLRRGSASSRNQN